MEWLPGVAFKKDDPFTNEAKFDGEDTDGLEIEDDVFKAMCGGMTPDEIFEGEGELEIE